MISTFQDIWIYEKTSQNICKLLLGATVKAQLVAKEGSYHIVMKTLNTDLFLTIYSFVIWQNAIFYFYLDNYHRVIKTCANKFSSDKWLLKYLYIGNYWNIVFKCADMLSIFIVTHSNNKWRKQNLENHHTDSLVNKFPARGIHVA